MARIVNKALLANYKHNPCEVGLRLPSDPHHVTTVGAGGDDVKENLIALCRLHHTEIHSIGRITFFNKYKGAKKWLELNKRFDILEIL